VRHAVARIRRKVGTEPSGIKGRRLSGWRPETARVHIVLACIRAKGAVSTSVVAGLRVAGVTAVVVYGSGVMIGARTGLVTIGRQEVTVGAQLIVVYRAVLQGRERQVAAIPMVASIHRRVVSPDDRPPARAPKEVLIVPGIFESAGDAFLMRQVVFGIVVRVLRNSGTPHIDVAGTGWLPVQNLRQPSRTIEWITKRVNDIAAAVLNRLTCDQ